MSLRCLPNQRATENFSAVRFVVLVPAAAHVFMTQLISPLRNDSLLCLVARPLILFSDGVDNASRTATEESNARSLRNSDTLIYPVQFNTYDRMKSQNERQRRAPAGSGFSDQDYLRANNYLHLLANLSGTGVYPANEIGDLDKAVASIVDELHNEYSVGYYPRNPVQSGEVRRIEVRVSLRQLVVKARTAYVVDKAGVAKQIATSEGRMTNTGQSSNASMPIPRSDEGSQLPLGARWICKGPDVPTDLVVVKEGFVAHCPASTRASDTTNAWFIRKPGQKETLCKGFLMWNGVEIAGAPVPTGYVVTGETVSTSCAKSSNATNRTNAWSIRLPREREVVCKGFQIPRGYVVVSEQESSECAAKAGANAWVIQTKR